MTNDPMTTSRLQALARDHAHEILIRLMPYGVELCRRHEPIIIGLLTWEYLDKIDVDATVSAAIAEHGLGLGFETDRRFQGQRPGPYQTHEFDDWHCGVCHTKLVHKGEHMPHCSGPTRACRICGCTDNDCSGCVAATGVPCSWVEADLCSACRDQGLPELIAEADAHEGVGPCVCVVPQGERFCAACGGEISVTSQIGRDVRVKDERLDYPCDYPNCDCDDSTGPCHHMQGIGHSRFPKPVRVP